MISQVEFINRIKQLQTFRSKTGRASYSDFVKMEASNGSLSSVT